MHLMLCSFLGCGVCWPLTMTIEPGRDDIEKSLNESLKKLDQYGIQKRSVRCVFMTAGNAFRCDDGIGQYLAVQLAPVLRGCDWIRLIDAGTTPENYIDEVISFAPQLVVFLDAANFGGKTGEFVLIEDETALPQSASSTHAIPLNLIAALIKTECDCAVVYIGIQAEDMQPGQALTQNVKAAADLFVMEIGARITGGTDA